jgi:hypothetical protein
VISMRAFLLTVFVGFSLVFACAGVSRAATNPPHIHAMPCPANVQPDRIHVAWTLDSVNGFHQTGARTLKSAKSVLHVYRIICAEALVTYSHKVVRSCPAPVSSGVYHLNFLLGARSLLRVTESIQGCETLYVDARPDLGLAYTVVLPQGIPRPPAPNA